MCALCRQNPCDSRCPNAPEPKPVAICVRCDEGIRSGEKYLDISGNVICESCVDSMKGKELLEYLGEELCVANEGDF